MPGKRRIFKRKAAPKTAYKMAKKALDAVKRSKPETKSYDLLVSAGGTGITNTGTLYRLTLNLAQGTASNQRVGQEIHMTSLTMRGILATGSLSAPQQVRMITLIDKEMDGVLPVVSDVIETYGGTTDFYSPYNMDNRGRFHILEDKVYSLNPGATASFHLNKYFKLGRKCQFGRLGTGATADSFAGQPFVLLITDVAAANPNFGLTTRLNYTEC